MSLSMVIFTIVVGFVFTLAVNPPSAWVRRHKSDLDQ